MRQPPAGLASRPARRQDRARRSCGSCPAWTWRALGRGVGSTATPRWKVGLGFAGRAVGGVSQAGGHRGAAMGEGPPAGKCGALPITKPAGRSMAAAAAAFWASILVSAFARPLRWSSRTADRMASAAGLALRRRSPGVVLWVAGTSCFSCQGGIGPALRHLAKCANGASQHGRRSENKERARRGGLTEKMA